MKVMLIMRSTAEAKAAYENADFEQIINAMGAYNEELMKAGVLLAGEGLADDLSEAFVVDFSADTPIVTDGPYGEVHELFNGFWILEVASKEEAVQWASRCPLGPGSKLEVRRVTDMSDFEGFTDNEYIQKEEGWREDLQARQSR
ncbi:MAG: YciI family protein [Mycetocola sp.]